MNHDDLGNYSHSYVADLRAQLQAANERAEVLTIYEQRLDEARRERDIAEQTNAALKAEVERLKLAKHINHTASGPEFGPFFEEIDHKEAEKIIADLTAARALNDTLAGALKVYWDHDDGCVPNTHWLETKAALSAYAKSKEAAK